MSMNVLSLFNGMGCIWLALERAGIRINKRYSSEIDKYACTVNDANYPDTIQLGDIRNVDVSKLEPIYLLAGGSPCQSFSFAGKRKGMTTKCEIEILTLEHYLELKSQNFEFEGQSYLFWEYIRILTDIRKYNPDVKFLLENVIMGSKWQKVITRAIGINPIKINSALVSAQNRNRIYWTNIYTEQDGLFGDFKCMIPQPKDKGFLLKDILESDVADKYFLSDKILNYLNGRKANYNNDKINYKTENDIASRINASSGSIDISENIIIARGNSIGLHSETDLVRCVSIRGRNPDNPKSRVAGLPTEQQLEARNDNKTGALTTVQKDNLVFTKNYVQWDISGKRHKEQQDRVHYDDGESGCIPSSRTESKMNVMIKNKTIRRLTPIECERLQTVPDNYTNYVSESQRYKMLGNGWTVDVVSYIFSFLKK